MFNKTNKLVFFYNFIGDISVFYSIDIILNSYIEIMYRYKNIYKYKNTNKNKNSYLINTKISSGVLGFDKYYFNYRLKYKDLVYEHRFYYYYKYYNIYIKKNI